MRKFIALMMVSGVVMGAVPVWASSQGATSQVGVPQAAAPAAVVPAPVVQTTPAATAPATTAPASAANLVAAAKNKPEDSVVEYLLAAAENNNNPNMPMYSRMTRQFLASNPAPTERMNQNMVASYARCKIESVRILGQLAVVRYPIENTACAPFFVVLEGGRWRLDLVTMRRVIWFDRENRWGFVPGASFPYFFAFSDWSFDQTGHPTGVKTAPK